jgi:hypothetical protein
MLIEVVVAEFEVLSSHTGGESEDNHMKRRAGYRVPSPKFEPRITSLSLQAVCTVILCVLLFLGHTTTYKQEDNTLQR